jgi:hypothetical protein
VGLAGQDRGSEIGESSELALDGHALECAEGMYAAVVLDPDPGDACTTCLGSLAVDFPGEPGAVI